MDADIAESQDHEGSRLDYLVLSHIRRTFGKTVALDDVSLRVSPGTVHTILGENGSGKSTLVKILSGVLSPNSGSVTIAGTPLDPATPRRARDLGIAAVFQEVLVAPNRSIVENVMLGQDRWWSWKLYGQSRVDLVLATLAELSRVEFDPRAEVGSLTLVQQQQVAIARALAIDPRVLVLDESTAAMDIAERDLLFIAVQKRVQEGMAVIFISHRLEEVLSLSDRVTILRSGSKVTTLSRTELSESRLVALLNAAEAA